MEVTYDLYKELELDRSWDEATIKSKLKEIQCLWIKRESACNDKEQLLLITDVLSKVEEGFRYLAKAIKRKIYDEALDKAYKEGRIQDATEVKMNSLLEKAQEYYRKGNVQLATQFAQEAVDGNINDPDAYELLTYCYYDMQNYNKAIEVVDAGTAIYKDNVKLYWLGARIASFSKRDFEDAQRRVNLLLEIAPDNSIGQSEQIYLHLQKGDEDLAFNEIDTYISSHPEDDLFKKNVAYDINSYANQFYYYDQTNNSAFIADKEAYEKCMKLCSKAVEIYKDEYTEKRLENAKYYGQKEWDGWNSESIKSLSIYGAILLFLYWPVGIILLAIDAMVIYFSYRPYWQINKTYVTGEMGPIEQLVTVVGDYTARFGGWFIRFIFKLIYYFFKFVLGIIFSGVR